MENLKLTQEELNEIGTLRNNFNNAYSNLGVVVSRIKQLKEEKQTIFGYLEELSQSELKIYEKLKSKYGNGTVDLNTGEFIAEK